MSDACADPDLGGRGLTTVPGGVLARDLRAAYLYDNDLRALPDRPRAWAGLRVLDLNRNPNLGALPEWVGGLERLEYLYVAGCGLTRLPRPQPAGLARLVYLNAADNRLTHLPDGMDALTSLRELRLQRNAIATLPAAVAGLTALRELHLDGNPLVALPEALGAPAELRVLSLRDTRVDALPDGLRRLTRLRAVDLRGTSVTALPEWLADLPALDTLDLRWTVWTHRQAPVLVERLRRRGCTVHT